MWIVRVNSLEDGYVQMDKEYATEKQARTNYNAQVNGALAFAKPVTIVLIAPDGQVKEMY